MRERIQALLRGERRAVLGTVSLGTGVLAATTAGVLAFSTAFAAQETTPKAAPATVRFSVSDDVVPLKPHLDRFRASASPVREAAGKQVAMAPLGPAVPAGDAQRIAAKLVAAHGWSDDDFACLVALWNRESHWNVHAANGNGAYGIPQAYPGSKMAAGGGDWRNDPAVQIRWGLGYIAGRYGSPCGAWAHSQATGSY